MNTREELTRLRYNEKSEQLNVCAQFASRRGTIKADYAKNLGEIETEYKTARRDISILMSTLRDSKEDGDEDRESQLDELKAQRRDLSLDFETKIHRLKLDYKMAMADLAQEEHKELSAIARHFDAERIAIFQRNIEERRAK